MEKKTISIMMLIIVVMITTVSCSSGNTSKVEGSEVYVFNPDSNNIEVTPNTTMTEEGGVVKLHFKNKVKDFEGIIINLSEGSYKGDIIEGTLVYKGDAPTDANPIMSIGEEIEIEKELAVSSLEEDESGAKIVRIPYEDNIQKIQIDTIERDDSLYANFVYVPEEGKNPAHFRIEVDGIEEEVTKILALITKINKLTAL